MAFSIGGESYTNDQILRNGASAIPDGRDRIQAACAAAHQLAADHEGERQAGISNL
jgi:hypothetical protein